MTRAARLTGVALALALAACGDDEAATTTPLGAGNRLEAAAVATGLVVDPTRAPLAGVYASDGDRVCIVPRDDAPSVFGVALDYGEGQRCFGRGTASLRGDRLAVRLGPCRFQARFDGNRIRFPAELPDACAALCRGRATLAAVDVPRLSEAVSEARSMRDIAGRMVCPD